MWRRKRFPALVLGLVGAVVLSACGGAGPAPDDAREKIGLILQARPEVEPWSASWRNSVEAVTAEDPGIQVMGTYEAYDATRAEPVVRQMLDKGANIMLLSTFVLADVAKSVAKDYPDVPMVVSSFGVTQEPNLSSVTASYLEIGYSTCWLLTKMAPDGRIGLVDAQGAPFETEIEQGCALGAQAANPDAELVTLSTNSFTDAQANREQVQTLLDEGIEQIYLVSGTEDAVGGLRLCEEAQAHCATWGGDAAQWAPTAAVLTVNMNWKVIVDDLLKRAESGPQRSQTYNLTYGTDGLEALNYAESGAVSDELKQQFGQVLADLASEKIALPESTAHPGYR